MQIKLENEYFKLSVETTLKDLEKIGILHKKFFQSYQESLQEIKKIGLTKILENKTPLKKIEVDTPPVIQEKVLDLNIDSAGIPWDERIHSPGKIKTKQGTWRAKSGVDKEFFRQIQDQLMLENQLPSKDQLVSVEEDSSVAINSIEIPLPPVVIAEKPDASFESIMKLINALLEAGRISKAGVNDVLRNHGDIKDLVELMGKPESFNAIYEDLEKLTIGD